MAGCGAGHRIRQLFEPFRSGLSDRETLDAHLVSRLGYEPALARLQAALREGTLIVLRRSRNQERLPASAPDELPPAPIEEEATDWIEIVVRDDEGRPYDGPYRIHLPDGSIFDGKLSNGRVRHSGIKPGTCKVTFPELDAAAWKKS